ncbi:MAG: glucose 1-dehydrogenase [Armatimonadetes bacterium]|nr:glucose 1-dehydrogenase [Armatimonadota bacterium]
MGNYLQGKVAVVTGSTSGIGAGIARTLAAEGAAVVVSGRRRESGEAVAAAMVAAGGRAVYQPTDLRDPEACRRVCRRAKEEFGGLDILVNNAAVFPRTDFLDVTPEFWDEMLDVNLRGAFLCSQAAVPILRERGGGSIINIGSGNAFGTSERLFAYGVSKGALYVMTMNLARILAPDRIRANWITVGWVLTEREFEVQAVEGNDRQTMLDRAASLPMGEYATPEDVAQACVYLAGDAAAHVTGSVVNTGAGLGIHA